MLDKTRFLLKQQTKFLMAKEAYDIANPDGGETMGTAAVKSKYAAKSSCTSTIGHGVT